MMIQARSARWAIPLLVSICGVIAACSPAEPETSSTSTTLSPPDTPPSERVLVRTGSLRRGEIRASIDLTADIESEVQVDVYAKVGPAYVERIVVDEGATVKAKDPLVYLDDVDFKIAVQRRQSELLQAEQRYAQSKVMLAGAHARERMQQASTERSRADYERAMKAAKGEVEVLSVKEIGDLTKEYEMRRAELEASGFSKDQAETELELARLSIDAAKIELDAAQKDLAYTVVRSPIDGTVQRRTVNLGVLVNSATQLFSLVDPTKLVANLRVPQEELGKVRSGLNVEFTFDALPGKTVVGQIEAISPSIDPSSGMARVRTRLPADVAGIVRPGMFSRVRIVVESRPNAVLIPKRAVVYQSGETWFFSEEEGVARRHQFSAGATTIDEMEMSTIDGAPADTNFTLITVGQDRLRDGDLVTVAPTRESP